MYVYVTLFGRLTLKERGGGRERRGGEREGGMEVVELITVYLSTICTTVLLVLL
jgi:hypothetical protein